MDALTHGKPISTGSHGALSSILRAITPEPKGHEAYAQPHHRVPSMVDPDGSSRVSHLDNLDSSIDMLEAAIKIDPLAYLKGALSTIGYGDMMQFAMELCALRENAEAVTRAEAHVTADLLYRWATNKKEVKDAPTSDKSNG